MRAAVTWETGGPFVLEDDVHRRDPRENEVVVRILAAGLCHTDISLARGQFGQTVPVVLGHEGVGDVVEAGPGASDLLGTRVLLTWVPPCGRCYFCTRGETYICAARRRSGDRVDDAADLTCRGRAVQAGMGTATLAQETVVPRSAVVHLPDDVPVEQAALLGCAVPTGVGAVLFSGRCRVGETVLVIGCGAVGLSAVMGAAAGGATEVVAVDPEPSRRRLALDVGATRSVDPTDLSSSPRPSGVGYDLVVDAVGSAATIRTAWDAARRGGRVVVVGAGGADEQVRLGALELFHDQKQLIGSFYGSTDMARDLPLLVGLWRAGRLPVDRLVSDVVPLADVNDAVARQVGAEALRVVLTP